MCIVKLQKIFPKSKAEKNAIRREMWDQKRYICNVYRRMPISQLCKFSICKKQFLRMKKKDSEVNCPFHKTLPRTSAFLNWISVRFYEIDCIRNNRPWYVLQIAIPSSMWNTFAAKLLYCYLWSNLVNL